MSESLIELFKYNLWANERLFDACAGLSDAQMDATVAGTFGSVRNTLMHIAGAQERVAAALAEAGPLSTTIERAPYPGLAALCDATRASGEALVELAARAESGVTVTTSWRGEDFVLPTWLLIVQAIVHGVEHRTQVATILTKQGIEPPAMDGWTYHEACFDGDWSRLWAW